MAQGVDLSIVTSFILGNISYIVVIMLILLVASLIVFININFKLARMNKRYKKLMTGMDGCNIERILMGHIDEVRSGMQKVEALEQDNKRLDLLAKKATQKIGVVRFSAFDDVGSDLSYAVAMLNHQNDGVVLSSLFGREESRCYAKPILNGQSTYTLTEEEKMAIVEAMKK